MDLKFLSLFNESWAKLPSSSEPVYSLDKLFMEHLLNARRYHRRDSTVQETIAFYDAHKLRGESVTELKLTIRFVFPVGL